MKHFLMCEPSFFEVRYVINPWMEGNQGRVDKVLARQQWKNLYDIVTARATVSLIEPVAGLPDMVFTANAGLVHNKDVIVSSFRHVERQPEARFFEKFFASLHYSVRHLSEETIFEGAGDALFDSQGRLWVGSGIRSDPHAPEEVAAVLDAETSGLNLVDPHWYHLDTAFCPLPEGQAIAYAKAFSGKSIETLHSAFGENIIWIAETDARNFACNAISIDRSVILHRASAELKFALQQRGFEVIEVDVSEFLKAGGACKCLTLEI
ncbi:dimethylarginine dimethylaminohydrolase family protein [Candidatus Ferrigenium straubiae]|jgi:N-dimethylarginine dimethylaminohydrolase|uniref:dimethylarginine dimethylaminohydrolase family protein n=1 Tax=Candidatus Ferrigenium straubiae TaxID=2919506 RepID=UPI003F4AF2ED